MATTTIYDVPGDDWVNVSEIFGQNAIVTNISAHTLIWQRGPSKPDAGTFDGHRVRSDYPFDYVVGRGEHIWMRGHFRPVRVAATPELGTSVFRGAVDIHDSCVHRAVYNQFMHYDTATTTTLAAPASTGDSTITVTSATGFAVGHQLKIENGSQEPLFIHIVAIAGDVLTLGTPLTYDHPVGADVTRVITDLSDPLFAGSTVASPTVFTSHVPAARVVHVINMAVVMVDDAAMDFTKFGGIAPLLNGIVVRAVTGGETVHFTNWRQNFDLDSDAFPVRYQTKTGGGEYGLAALYNIKANTEAVVYLDGFLGDRLEVLIQDDISTLTTMEIKLQGHYEGL